MGSTPPPLPKRARGSSKKSEDRVLELARERGAVPAHERSEAVIELAHDRSGAFLAPTPWDENRPQALALCCSDGRWHPQMHEFLAHQGLDRADLYVVPGGAACIDWWASSAAEAWAFQGAFRLLMEHHDLRSVWLVAHEGCAYYRIQHPLVESAKLVAIQQGDLSNAREAIRRRYPNLVVTCVMASLVDGRALFDILD